MIKVIVSYQWVRQVLSLQPDRVALCFQRDRGRQLNHPLRQVLRVLGCQGNLVVQQVLVHQPRQRVQEDQTVHGFQQVQGGQQILKVEILLD